MAMENPFEGKEIWFGVGSQDLYGEEALRQLADEVVREHFGPLIVTPKEIDALIGDTAEMLADGINRMLQRECFAELKALFG